MEASERSAIVDSIMRPRLDRESLRYAVGLHMFCPFCRVIMDCRRAALVTHPEADGSATLCVACLDARRDTVRAGSEILDGRELWPEHKARPRKQQRPKGGTVRSRLRRALDKLGCTTLGRYHPGWSRRYETWIPSEPVRHAMGPRWADARIYIGPQGAIRIGTCVSRSLSVTVHEEPSPGSVVGRILALAEGQ